MLARRFAFRNNELGKLILEASQWLVTSTMFEDFIHQSQGPSDLHQEIENLEHPATSLLQRYQDKGVPFHTESEPWTLDKTNAALKQGHRQSAHLYKDLI